MALTPEFVTSGATTRNLLTVAIKISVPDIEPPNLDGVPLEKIDESLERLRMELLSNLKNKVGMFEKTLMMQSCSAAVMIESFAYEDETRFCRTSPSRRCGPPPTP